MPPCGHGRPNALLSDVPSVRYETGAVRGQLISFVLRLSFDVAREQLEASIVVGGWPRPERARVGHEVRRLAAVVGNGLGVRAELEERADALGVPKGFLLEHALVRRLKPCARRRAQSQRCGSEVLSSRLSRADTGDNLLRQTESQSIV